MFETLSEFMKAQLQFLVQMLPTYGYLMLLIAAFLESIVTLSLVVPGSFLLAMSAVFAGQGILELPLVMGTAYIATLAGDQISYQIGRSQSNRLLSLFRIPREKRNYEAWIGGNHYAVFIVLAHFSPFLRSFGPAACGMFNVPYRGWMPFDCIGAGVWVLSISAVGYFFGLQSRQMGLLEQVGSAVLISFVLNIAVSQVLTAVRRQLHMS